MFFSSRWSRNFDDQLRSNLHRFVIVCTCICWDTPNEKTGLYFHVPCYKSDVFLHVCNYFSPEPSWIVGVVICLTWFQLQYESCNRVCPMHALIYCVLLISIVVYTFALWCVLYLCNFSPYSTKYELCTFVLLWVSWFLYMAFHILPSVGLITIFPKFKRTAKSPLVSV